MTFLFHADRWLTPEKQAWYHTAHPDAEGHPKCKLLVSAVRRMQNSHWIPPSSEVVVWADFSCMNQDGNPREELDGRLVEIIAGCDFVLTCVVDPEWQAWGDGMDRSQLQGGDDETTDPFTVYGAAGWQDYATRAWCRLEAFIGATAALPPHRTLKLGEELKRKASSRRPHLLYGTREHAMGELPIILPVMRPRHFNTYHPGAGGCRPEDKPCINGYVDALYEINAELKEVRALDADAWPLLPSPFMPRTLVFMESLVLCCFARWRTFRCMQL